jgi:hypothetical protein
VDGAIGLVDGLVADAPDVGSRVDRDVLRLVGNVGDRLIALVEGFCRGVTDLVGRLRHGVLHMFGRFGDFVFEIGHETLFR